MSSSFGAIQKACCRERVVVLLLPLLIYVKITSYYIFMSCLLFPPLFLNDSVKRVDGARMWSRRTTTIQWWVYTVPFTNYIWHIDGNNKLIRWKLVKHCAMDGYSRMLMFFQCYNNNRAETVFRETWECTEVKILKNINIT